MPQTTDWQTLIYDRAESDVLLAIMGAINRGEVLDGLAGLEEMIQLMSRREAREIESRLVILMAHILKWKTQPPGTKGWRHTIEAQRTETARLRRYAPRFTRERILTEVWQEALTDAHHLAERDLDRPPAVQELAWEEVFEDTYDERQTEAGPR